MFRKGIKRYFLGPLVINLLLYLLAGFYLIEQFSRLLDWGTNLVPEWLSFLVPVIWILFAALSLVAVGYSFAIVAMIIGAPFHGLLAEKVAVEMGYRNFDEPLTLKAVIRMTAHAFKRELIKLLYYLPRIALVVLVAFILSFVPILNILAPMLTFAWAAWSMAIQFIDYPADNDQIEFRPMLSMMKKQRRQCLVFGSAAALLISIPIINLIAIPATVAGATKLWLEEIEYQVESQ